MTKPLPPTKELMLKLIQYMRLQAEVSKLQTQVSQENEKKEQAAKQIQELLSAKAELNKNSSVGTLRRITQLFFLI